VVAINFKPEWVPAILDGSKRQTIRRTARCKAGDELQLYTGQRTKDCRLLGTAICQHVETITIADDYLSAGYYRIPSGDAHHLAEIDGFADIEAMRDWFRSQYGALPFDGVRIMWSRFIPAE
jgi:hypothetical protein